MDLMPACFDVLKYYYRQTTARCEVVSKRDAASAMSVMPDVTTGHITSASGEISSFFAFGLGFFIYDLTSKEESKL